MDASAPEGPTEVTRLLRRWSEGDQGARDRLMPLVYDELRRVARRRLAAEPAHHTLQPTALVHEAFIRLAGTDLGWEDRVHFFALAARTMRRILVDHARARSADKRGGGARRVPLAEVDRAGGTAADDAEILALHEALEALEAKDARKARVVELHVFAGLTYEETAAALGISPATVDRDLRMARAWLASRMA